MINKSPIYLLTVFEKNGNTLNKYKEKILVVKTL